MGPPSTAARGAGSAAGAWPPASRWAASPRRSSRRPHPVGDIDLRGSPTSSSRRRGGGRRNSFAGARTRDRGAPASSGRGGCGLPVALPAARREAAPTRGGGRPGAELLDTVEPIIPAHQPGPAGHPGPRRRDPRAGGRLQRGAVPGRHEPAPPHRRWRSLSSMPRLPATRCLAPSHRRRRIRGGAL